MNEKFNLTPLDRDILDCLQENARLSNQEIAERCASSASSVWRRIRAMEEAGVITGYHAAVDAEKLGLSEMILLHVSLDRHTEQNTRDFTNLVMGTPAIQECYAITGEHDYVMKVLATDMRAYYRLLEQQLMSQRFVDKTSSMVVMQKLKERAAIKSQ